MKNSIWYRLFSGILCIIFSAIFMFPLILMMIKSFDKSGFKNYAKVFDTVNLLPNFKTSVLVVSGTLLIVAVVTTMAAFAFSKLNFWGKSKLYYLLLMGMMMPTAALIFPIFQIVKGIGINNTAFSLIFPYATLNAVFNLMVLKNYFDSLPNELIEAAYIDGANIFKIFIRIMVPLSVPGVTIVLIQTFLLAWNELYAALVICLSPIALFYIFAQKFMAEGMTAGAVKG